MICLKGGYRLSWTVKGLNPYQVRCIGTMWQVGRAGLLTKSCVLDNQIHASCIARSLLHGAIGGYPAQSRGSTLTNYVGKGVIFFE